MQLRACMCLMVAAIACGDGNGTGDAGPADAPPASDASTVPDAATPDALVLVVENCPEDYGAAAVAATFAIVDETTGFDVDGDGDIDNQVGSSELVRNLINTSLADSLAEGDFLSLFELRDFGGFGADDPDVTFVFYGGVDSDDPAVIADDFDGDEAFYFDHASVVAASCAPHAELAGSYTDDGSLDGSTPGIRVFIASLGGALEIANAELAATIEAGVAGFQTVTGEPLLIGGAITSCSLVQGESPLGPNILHTLVQLGMQPDIDLDGDGLETFVNDDDGIATCTDGNGEVVTGDPCPCEASIADGYSIAFAIEAVGATVLGPDPNP